MLKIFFKTQEIHEIIHNTNNFDRKVRTLLRKFIKLTKILLKPIKITKIFLQYKHFDKGFYTEYIKTLKQSERTRDDTRIY